MIYALSCHFLLSISRESSPQPCSGSSTGSFSVLLVTLSEGGRGRACGTKFMKSTVQLCTVESMAFTHDSPTDSPGATFSLVSSIRGKCHIQVCHILIFMLYFHCTFSMFKYIRDKIFPTVLKLPTVFSSVTCCTDLQPRSRRLWHTASVCIRLYTT